MKTTMMVRIPPFHLHLFALRPLSFIVIMHLICIGRDVKFFIIQVSLKWRTFLYHTCEENVRIGDTMTNENEI
mgnify:CR=1 FL=1